MIPEFVIIYRNKSKVSQLIIFIMFFIEIRSTCIILIYSNPWGEAEIESRSFFYEFAECHSLLNGIVSEIVRRAINQKYLVR